MTLINFNCPIKAHRKKKRFNTSNVRRKSLSLRVSIPRSLYKPKKLIVPFLLIVYSNRDEGNKKVQTS